MNILILGGGVFLGAAVLDAAIDRGHEVTVFNRGRARADWPKGVEAIVGDRSTDLGLLDGRRFDAVVDTSGYVPVDVRRSCEALRETRTYCFVSSISAYRSFEHAPVRETDRLADFEKIAPDDRDAQHYGAQKASCEDELWQVFGDRGLVVRPGLIVGPGDPTGRFSYWPWRTMQGGEMLVPDLGDDEPLQFIDVRDLAAWMVRLLEREERGVFNATGPAKGEDVTWGDLIGACQDEVEALGGSPAEPIAVSEDFLLDQDVAPWTGLPLWLPSQNPEYRGHSRVEIQRAEHARLVTRPLEQTVRAVLAEAFPPEGDKRRDGRLTREREAELLAAWHAGAAERERDDA